MKRITAILLSILLLGTLVACNQVENPSPDGKLKLDKATIEIGATHTDVEGMEIQIVNAIWNDDEIKLDVNWINKTRHEVVYGDSYDIEREDNDEWTSCVTLDNLAFDSIGYELKSGVTQKKTFIDFVPQYIRTDGYHEDIEYPVVKIIHSVQELNAYYETNKELYIAIRTIEPETGTDDMAQWHILIEPEKDVDVITESNVIVYLDGVNPKTQPTTVREAGSYSNISLTIPHDWKYETERGNDSGDYCISFWPEDQTEGKIKMWYYDTFGVCGTGLEVKEITVGNYKARKGTYDNRKVWDFICFADTPGSYVAMNEGADKWWSQYGDEAMQILSSIKIAESIITEEQAIEIAKKNVTVEYNQTSARFDTEKGLWIVSFSKKNTAGGDQILSITHEGKVIDVEYSE